MARFLAVLQYDNAVCCKYELIGDPTKYIPLYEPLSTVLARRRSGNSGSRAPAPNADQVVKIAATWATNIPPNRGVWGRVTVPCTTAVGASHLYTGGPLFFLQIESLLQPKLEGFSTVRERSIKDMPNVSFHECDRLRVSGVRHQKIALHLHEFLMAWGAY